ncbi:MAG: hypothetical protein ACO1SV_04620 [Fimbriimonas sp.]
MPAHRYAVDCHDHTIVDGEFCIDCGTSILDVHEDEQMPHLRWQVGLAWAEVLVGAAACAFGQMVLAGRLGKGPLAARLYETVKPNPKAPQEVPEILSYAYLGVRLGSLLLIACVLALLFLPAAKRRRSLI